MHLSNLHNILHLFVVGTTTALKTILCFFHGVIFCRLADVLHLQVLQPQQSQPEHRLWCCKFAMSGPLCAVHVYKLLSGKVQTILGVGVMQHVNSATENLVDPVVCMAPR